MKVEQVRAFVTGICIGYAIMGWGCIIALLIEQNWLWWAKLLVGWLGLSAWGVLSVAIRNSILTFGKWA